VSCSGVVKRLVGRGWVGEVMGGRCGMRRMEAAVRLGSGCVAEQQGTAMAVCMAGSLNGRGKREDFGCRGGWVGGDRDGGCLGGSEVGGVCL
jgi:hypothetical protein